MCNVNREPIEVEHLSANTKLWMFGAFIHDSEMTNNEATAGSIPTLRLQLNPQPLEELPARATLSQHLQEKYLGWSKPTGATWSSFGVHIMSSCSKLLLHLTHLWKRLYNIMQLFAFNYGALSSKKENYFLHSLGFTILRLANVAAG